MKRRIILLIAVLAALSVHPSIDVAATAPQVKAVSEMADAAVKFWNSLTPEQQSKAGFGFADDERKNWFFTPVPRKGLPWKELTPAQRELGHAFLKAGLSPSGYEKATATMANEATLGTIEAAAGTTANRRDPEMYFFSIFGKPGTDQTWGWRIEGHHVAFNFTVAGNMAIVAPHFIGANPAKVPEGRPNAGSRILAAEEDKGRALVKALNDQQRKTAIISETAPREILTTNTKKLDPMTPAGITGAQLTEDQKKMLVGLISEYTGRLRGDLAQQDMQKIEQAGIDKVYFAWAGTMDVGGPHYYRIQGPTFLIEYDDTQNNANHIHSVWRDPANDFGEDILREHYAKNPH